VIDYKDFIKLGGTMYYVADHGVGRSIERGDLGPVFAVVRGNPPRNDPTLTYRPRDGDAAYLPAGSPVHTVKLSSELPCGRQPSRPPAAVRGQ
jgi:hypothetical protein